MREVSTHIWAPMPGRSALFAATYGHCGVSEAVGIDPHDTHLEPVRQVKTPGGGRGRGQEAGAEEREIPEGGEGDTRRGRGQWQRGKHRLTRSPAPGPALASHSTHWHCLPVVFHWLGLVPPWLCGKGKPQPQATEPRRGVRGFAGNKPLLPILHPFGEQSSHSLVCSQPQVTG